MQPQKGCSAAETSRETSGLDGGTSSVLPDCDSVLQTSGINQKRDREWGGRLDIDASTWFTNPTVEVPKPEDTQVGWSKQQDVKVQIPADI